MLRYGCVSAGSLVVGIGLLIFFAGVLDWPAPAANLLGAAISVGPLYLISRRWIWAAQAARGRVGREASLFWAASLAGVGLSTLSAKICEVWISSWHLSHRAATCLVVIAVICGYGVAWMLRFLALDLLVWPQRPGWLNHSAAAGGAGTTSPHAEKVGSQKGELP